MSKAAATPGIYSADVNDNVTVRCCACGGVNHFARECPTRCRSMGTARKSGSRAGVGNRGQARAAVVQNQGNDDGEEAFAPAFPVSDEGAASRVDKSKWNTSLCAGGYRLHPVHRAYLVLPRMAKPASRSDNSNR
ncbi:hypothetical protein M514_02144 [Trichuris suis]|uniref:CCHC-type domain-containing protein n=1 Tax=Trichuris suis TaxID=68888 RepID=A0A085N9H7_9BILA|nr:hypothetical protein M513_02144 [Trichuris suis]KFD66123.1 hypothetical protein M514_02144 [Trichuris suis]